jgi:hypothetical protein
MNNKIKKENSLKRRIELLEQSQKVIVNILRKQEKQIKELEGKE